MSTTYKCRMLATSDRR